MKKTVNFLRLAVCLFTVAYMVYFFVHAYITQNYEFFYYAIVIGILLFLLIRISSKIYLRTYLLAGISGVVLLNFLGGIVYIHGTRLYEICFFGDLIKYDGIVHFVSATVLAMLVLSLLFELMKNKFPKTSVGQMLFYFMAFFAAFGVLATIEILEFIAVGFFGVADTVGDYYNNAMDLVFDFWGIFVVTLIFILYHMKKEKYWFFGDGKN